MGLHRTATVGFGSVSCLVGFATTLHFPGEKGFTYGRVNCQKFTRVRVRLTSGIPLSFRQITG